MVVARGKTKTPDSKWHAALETHGEISAHEAWLYENNEALQRVKRGLQDAKAGMVHDLGDFTKFIDK